MVKRIITSVVALAVFVGILFLPPICFTVALAAVILFMLYECYSATKADVGMKTIGFISAVILMSSIYFLQSNRVGYFCMGNCVNRYNFYHSTAYDYSSGKAR